MNRLFLGRLVRHPALGAGVISFEEQDVANTARTLQATFPERVLTGNVTQLRDDGVRWQQGERLHLPEHREVLHGHHGARGLAIDEEAARRELASTRERVAA